MSFQHGSQTAPSPSLPLQILLYFHDWYTLLWFATNVVLFIWKRQQFFYETSTFRWEISMIIFQTIIDFIRVEFASMGNKMGDSKFLLWSCCLSVPALVGFSFYLRLQSYVLNLDVVLNSIGIAFVSSEVLLMLFQILYGLYMQNRR